MAAIPHSILRRTRMLGASITVFAANASGDAKPIRVIPRGKDHQKSMIGNPKALAVYDP